MNFKIRRNSFGEDDDEGEEEQEEEKINMADNGAEKEVRLGLKKNVLKLKELATAGVVGLEGKNLMIAGANTPLIKYELESGTVVGETPMPIHCVGMASDARGAIWVHNANNHKLIKIGPNLNTLKEWQGEEDLNLGKVVQLILRISKYGVLRSNE
jgi:hypothetical protein